MQPATKKPKLSTETAMTRADWAYWENEVVHSAAGQVHLVKQWPQGSCSPETPMWQRRPHLPNHALRRDV